MDRSRIWEALFALSDMHGHAGAEMRALSAIDIALWDLAGRHTGLPVFELLGGAMRDRVATYNTVKDGGPFADETLAETDPARLARDLVEGAGPASRPIPSTHTRQSMARVRTTGGSIAVRSAIILARATCARDSTKCAPCATRPATGSTS
jgi:L-alanine-DL-glutamate epimerase-like enolase superfamily enzyme